MSTVHLERPARAMVADGKGILAADETPGTLTERFEAHGIESTPDCRRAYRELFLTTAGTAARAARCLRGVRTVFTGNGKRVSGGHLRRSSPLTISFQLAASDPERR